MSNDFVRCLQQKQPLSLIILAYYAFLLTTLKRDWYVQSWPRHILTRVREMVDKDILGGYVGPWTGWHIYVRLTSWRVDGYYGLSHPHPNY
jgi:hypothetical protein